MKIRSWQQGRYTGQNGILTLIFTSGRGRAALEAIGTLSDNWPHDQPETDSNANSSNHWSSFAKRSKTDPTPGDSATYRLRIQDPSQERTKEYPCLKDVSLGYPVARGCMAYLEMGLPCTLLQEGSTYPCVKCTEAGNIECELILPPPVKCSCESCRRRRIVCSYREEGIEHRLPCRYCADSTFRCVAGLLSGRTKSEPSSNQVSHKICKVGVKPERLLRW